MTFKTTKLVTAAAILALSTAGLTSTAAANHHGEMAKHDTMKTNKAMHHHNKVQMKLESKMENVRMDDTLSMEEKRMKMMKLQKTMSKHKARLQVHNMKLEKIKNDDSLTMEERNMKIMALEKALMAHNDNKHDVDMTQKSMKKSMDGQVVMQKTTQTTTTMTTDDKIGDILQSNETNVVRVKGDDELLMSVGVTEEPEIIDMEERRSTAADNAIAVPTTDGQFVTTVACPIGTTAQPDMTCLVTGDYKPSL